MEELTLGMLMGVQSMSSPVVAGAIALWLQAYPRLTPQDCLEVFRKTCTQYDTSLSYPNIGTDMVR